MAMMAMVGHSFGGARVLPGHLHFSHTDPVIRNLKSQSPFTYTKPLYIINPILTTAAVPVVRETTVFFCNSSPFPRNRRRAKILPLSTWAFKTPGRATTRLFSQSLASPNPSLSTLRTSFVNPDSGSSGEHEQSKPPRPSVSDPPLVQFKALKSAELKLALQSKRKRRLKYFTHLAGLLAGEGRMLEFAEFLQMLADAGINRAIFTVALDSTQVDAGLCLLLVKGQVDVFVTVMKKLKKAGYEAWQFAGKGARGLLADELSNLLATGRAQYCVQYIQSLSECGFLVKKLIDPARVIASCAKARNLPLAHSFVKLLSRNPWHYNLMIREFGYHHELHYAFNVLDIMKEEGVAPDLYTYRALIDSCARGSEPSKATIVFEGMIKDGFKPNVFVYNSMMNANVGDMDEVQLYYRHMQGAGVAADLTTFNILLKACGASGRPDLAVGFYRDIQQRADLTMDVVTYSTLINVFGGAKMWEEALMVKADMLASGVTPNVVTWTSIIGACATAGLVEQSFREFDEMLNAGCIPNVNCYNMLLHACVKASQYERAFQLFQEWKQTGRIRSYSEIVNHPDPLTRAYELIAVTEIFPGSVSSQREIQSEPPLTAVEKLRHEIRNTRCKPNLVTYNTLMKACGSTPEKARALMKEMEGLGIVADLKSWSILMDAYGSQGDFAGCLEALEEMKAAGYNPDVIAFTAVIKGCVQAREPDKAFDFFNQMKAAGVRPNVVTYNTLLRAQRNYGKFHEVQRALAVYEEMREAGYAPNDFLLQGLLKEWAEGISNAPIHLGGDGGSPDERDSDKGISEYTEALVQKVAVHARSESNTGNLTIDLHGLSKGEARTAVLAVLRIIKERHMLGNPVENDLIIITGMGHRSEIKGVSVIREVVIGVLQKELGLPVMCVPLDNQGRMASAEGGREEGGPELVGRFVGNRLVEVRPRKPVNSGRLKVTKEALQAWLGKKTLPLTAH